MIKIGKLTDYAIVLMSELARTSEGALLSARHLSEVTGLSEPTVAKILKDLSGHGLVASVRGSAGGYQLTRSAQDISCADIIEALEGPIRIVSCAEGAAGDCQIEGVCRVKGHWDQANMAIRQALATIKLSDMNVNGCGKAHDFIQVRKTVGK